MRRWRALGAARSAVDDELPFAAEVTSASKCARRCAAAAAAGRPTRRAGCSESRASRLSVDELSRTLLSSDDDARDRRPPPTSTSLSLSLSLKPAPTAAPPPRCSAVLSAYACVSCLSEVNHRRYWPSSAHTTSNERSLEPLVYVSEKLRCAVAGVGFRANTDVVCPAMTSATLASGRQRGRSRAGSFRLVHVSSAQSGVSRKNASWGGPRRPCCARGPRHARARMRESGGSRPHARQRQSSAR